MFYTGAVKQPWDERNYIFEERMGAVEIDWEKGYDVRNDLGGHIFLKNQFRSSSCVSQAWSYDVWKFQVLEMQNKYGLNLEELRIKYPEEVQEVSPKSIYPFIRLEGGGAYIGTGAKQVCTVGSLFEETLPSHKEDGMTDEDFLSDKSWWNDEMAKIAKILSGKEYNIIRSQDKIDLFAQAILLNKGIVSGVEGENNNSWLTEFPKPPINKIWGHALWFGAFGIKDGKKFVASPNSWGEMNFNKGYRWKQGDPIGEGWQKITEDYFNSHNGDDIFDPWTYSDKLNNDMLELIKGEKTEVYAVGKDGLLYHVYNEATFNKGRSMGLWGDWSSIKKVTQEVINLKSKGNSLAFLI